MSIRGPRHGAALSPSKGADPVKLRKPLALLLALALACSAAPAALAEEAAGPASQAVSAEPTMEEPVEKPAGPPAEEPVEEPAEPPVEEPVEEPTEPPVEEPVEEPAEPSVDEPVEEPAGPPVDEPVEEPTEPPVEEPVVEPAEPPAEEPVEEPAEEPVEEPVEEPAGPPAEEPVEEPAEPPVLDAAAEAPVAMLMAADDHLMTEQPNDAAVIRVEIEPAYNVQINPYHIAVKPFGAETDDAVSHEAVIHQPCLITSKTGLPLEVKAAVTATPRGGIRLLESSAAGAPQEEKNLFLFFEMQTVSDQDMTGAVWTAPGGYTGPTDFDPDGDGVVDSGVERAVTALREGEDVPAGIVIPGASESAPNYAAFRIGGDASLPEDIEQWTAEDSVSISIVFTFTSQLYYDLTELQILDANTDVPIDNPNITVTTEDGQDIRQLMEDHGGRLRLPLGKDFIFHIAIADPAEGSRYIRYIQIMDCPVIEDNYRYYPIWDNYNQTSATPQEYTGKVPAYHCTAGESHSLTIELGDIC